jgi:hypothetical protein
MTLLSAGTARNKKRRQQGVKTESNTPGSGRNGNCVSARLAAQQRLPRRCQKASIKGRVAGLAPKTSNQRGGAKGARGHACLMLDSLLLRYSALKMSWELALVIVKVRRHDARTPGVCHERVDK